MSPDMLRKLSEADLQALAAGDLSRVSTAGLQAISGRQAAPDISVDPTEGMSRTQRVLANVGAGMADLGLGVRQLYTDMTGTDQEKATIKQEVADKRRRDEALAAAAPGGRLVGKGLQVAGGVAPTLAVPVGAVTALPRALGMMGGTAARAGTGALALDAAATGAAYGAIAPLAEGENRGSNVMSGAALSAAAPLVLAGGRGGLNMVTRGGGERRAAAQIADELSEATGQGQREVLQQTLARLRQAQGQGTPAGIPLSTAAVLDDAALARLERGSRTRNAGNWYDFDQTQSREVWNQVQGATRGADDLAARRTLRSDNRDRLYQQAMSTVNEPAFARDLAGFRASLDAAARTPEASNPAVRNMLSQLADEIDRLGPDFRPEHLATIRANLASKAPMVPTNAYQAAPRESPATMSVMREVDNILNNATGGRWQGVLGGYKRDSDVVRASQAAGRVRESFVDPATGRVRNVAADSAGDVPKITEAGLGRALDAARGPRKELVLDPTANARLEAVLDALRRQGITQRVARTATSGGGSNTASDQIAAGAAESAANALGSVTGPVQPVASSLMKSGVDYVKGLRERALADALQNPQTMLRLLEQRIQAGQPLSAQEQQLYALLRGLPAAAVATSQ